MNIFPDIKLLLIILNKRRPQELHFIFNISVSSCKYENAFDFGVKKGETNIKSNKGKYLI